MTPFLLACSTGMADVVMMLVRRGLDASHEDNKHRGALQLAEKCQGKNGDLKEWLLENAFDPQGRPLRMTFG